MTPVLQMIKKFGCKEPIQSGDWLRTNAFYRGGSGMNLSIHCKTGAFHDFATGKKGTFEELMNLANLKLSPEELKRMDFAHILVEEDAIFEDLNVNRKISAEILDQMNRNYQFYKYQHISPNIMTAFEGGQIKTGKFYNRYVFPIFDENKGIVGLAGRKLDEGTVRPKWLIVGKKMTFQYPLFLNKDIILLSDSVYLVESIGDVLGLFNAGIYNVLCLFGLSISPSILSFLIRSNLSKIIISTNNDEKSRQASQTIHKKLLIHFGSSKISIKLPPDQIKDWGECPKSIIIEQLIMV